VAELLRKQSVDRVEEIVADDGDEVGYLDRGGDVMDKVQGLRSSL
jgi:hypothetical protein